MLTRLRLHNFKAFASLDIRLCPLTFFLGPNNSGKSSIIAALRLLVQTLDSNDPTVPLLFNGNLGDFGTFKDVVHGNYRGRLMEMSLGARLAPRSTRATETSEVAEDIRIDLAFKFRKNRRELVLKTSSLAIDGSPYLETEYGEESERQQVRRIGLADVPSPLKGYLSERLRMQNFLPHLAIYGAEVRDAPGSGEFLSKSVLDLVRRSRMSASVLAHYLRSVDYLGARRHPPERTYLFSGERRHRIGARGENASAIYVLDGKRTRKGQTALAEDLGKWYANAGIGSGVSVQALSDRHYELRVHHPVTGEQQNIADVGFGNSQVFPVLVGGYSRKPGSTFVVEEPEIHLHPRAQAALGDLFADLYDRQVRSVVETHSEHMILRIQQHVASGRIRPEDVVVYYISPTPLGKEVVEMRIDAQGRFLGDWPEGFFPERLEESRALSRIRQSALAEE